MPILTDSYFEEESNDTIPILYEDEDEDQEVVEHARMTPLTGPYHPV